MMTTVKGHFNGTNIVLDENIELVNGQVVFVTVSAEQITDTPKKIYDLKKYIVHGEKKLLDRDAAEVIREDRDNDRF